MLWNKLRYLLLLIVVGLLAILYNEYQMGILFLTVFILPFLTFALLSYLFGNIKVELVSEAHIVNKGDRVPISLQIHNPTFLPISNMKVYIDYRNAFSMEKHTKEFQLSVDQKTKAYITFKITSHYAGNLVVSIKGIRIYDYLKLFSLKKKLRGEIKAAILPNYYELPESYLINRQSLIVESDYYSPYKRGDDPSEVFEIREYREGDRLQRIHWKLSKKLDQLMIKEFSNPLNCSILLFVDLMVPSGENALYYLDSILECSLSLSLTFLMKGQLHYFSWYDNANSSCRRVRISEEKDLYEAVDGLLQAKAYSETTDALVAYLAEYPNEQYSQLCYTTGEMSANMLDLLSLVKANSRQIIYVNNLQHAGYEELPAEILEQAKEKGFCLWQVNIANVRKDMESIRIE